MSILVDADTTFIVQGITGREAVNLTRECLDYGAGAKIVGGVTPGRLGRDVHGVPVFDTVAQAVAHHGGPIDGSVVTVPPAFTKDAVLEALESADQEGLAMTRPGIADDPTHGVPLSSAPRMHRRRRHAAFRRCRAPALLLRLAHARCVATLFRLRARPSPE